MQAPSIDSIREFLLKTNAGSPEIRNAIEDILNCDIFFDADQFVFSLEGLWRLCDPQETLSFNDFRRMLYASELNQQLRTRGLEVAIYRSTGKVSSNLYCLKATCANNSD